MSSILPSIIDYGTYNVPQPKYKYVRINPSNLNSSSLTIGATSSSEVSFKMPYNTVFNLSKSYLSYTLTSTASGNEAHFKWSHMDTLDIVGPTSNVSFETAEGLALCSIAHAGKVIKLMRKLKTSYQELINNDDTSGLNPMSITGASTLTPLNTETGNATLDAEYCRVINANDVGYKYRNYPLGALPGIFELDKDLYFSNRDMYFKFSTATDNQIFWKATGVASAGPPVVLASEDYPASVPAEAGADVTVSGLCLYLCVEVNPDIVDPIRRKFDAGDFKFNTDYIVVSKNATTSAGNMSIMVPYTPAYGHLLKRVIHSVWSGTETMNKCYDCENTGGAKLSEYVTYLDATQQQDQVVKCAVPNATVIGLDDWRINKEHLKNSFISNYKIYQANWCHIDDFSLNPNDPEYKRYNENTKDGLKLDHSLQWSIQGTVASNVIHLTIGVFNREIRVTKDFVQFE